MMVAENEAPDGVSEEEESMGFEALGVTAMAIEEEMAAREAEEMAARAAEALFGASTSAMSAVPIQSDGEPSNEDDLNSFLT